MMMCKDCANGKCGGHGCTPAKIAKALLVIGGLNWGLIGVGMLMGRDWNVVNMILGSWPTVEAIIYVLVGVSAVVKIFGCRCRSCMAGGAEGGMKM